VDDGTRRGQKFDLYIPDAIFDGFDGPPTLRVTIESADENFSQDELREMFDALSSKLK
jgi:hypothetical protein